MLVHNYIKVAKQKQKRHADKGCKVVELRVGNSVYAKTHRRTNKLENRMYAYLTKPHAIN